MLKANAVRIQFSYTFVSTLMPGIAQFYRWSPCKLRLRAREKFEPLKANAVGER